MLKVKKFDLCLKIVSSIELIVLQIWKGGEGVERGSDWHTQKNYLIKQPEAATESVL